MKLICSTSARFLIALIPFKLVFSDRSKVKSGGFQTISKGNNLPPRLDTVGVCGSNPHAPTIFVPEIGVCGVRAVVFVLFFVP